MILFNGDSTIVILSDLLYFILFRNGDIWNMRLLCYVALHISMTFTAIDIFIAVATIEAAIASSDFLKILCHTLPKYQKLLLKT